MSSVGHFNAKINWIRKFKTLDLKYESKVWGQIKEILFPDFLLGSCDWGIEYQALNKDSINGAIDQEQTPMSYIIMPLDSSSTWGKCWTYYERCVSA